MSDKPTPPVDFILGLDLGQAADYTALAIIERSRQPNAERPGALLSHYAVRHLKRWPLKTSYTTITEELKTLVARPPLSNPMLAVDQTGVGRAVVDMLRAARLVAWLHPVVITGGHEINPGDDGATHVPKKELVSVVQVLLQERRLKVADVPERELLVKELLAFKHKITATAKNEYEAWRVRDHDDLVLALALGLFVAEQYSGPGAIEAHGPARDPFASRPVHQRNLPATRGPRGEGTSHAW
jgi:hypothetical protein